TIGLICLVLATCGPLSSDPPQQSSVAAPSERVVYIGGGLSDEDLITFTTCAAASGRSGFVLLDTPRAARANQVFLTALQPRRVVPVGSFPQGAAELERRLGMTPSPVLPWRQGLSTAVGNDFFPKVERVVVCPAS